jgi:hypothetical protein
LKIGWPQLITKQLTAAQLLIGLLVANQLADRESADNYPGHVIVLPPLSRGTDRLPNWHGGDQLTSMGTSAE